MHEHLPKEAHGCEREHDKGMFFLFVCFFGDKAYISCPSSAAGEAKAFKIFIFLIVDILRHVYT